MHPLQWTSTISTHDASLQFTELKLPWINQTCVVVHIWLIIQNIYLVRKISVVRLFNIHNNPNSPLQVFWQICMSSPCNDLIKVKIPGEKLDVIVIAKETNTLHCKTQWPLCKARQGQGRAGKGGRMLNLRLRTFEECNLPDALHQSPESRQAFVPNGLVHLLLTWASTLLYPISLLSGCWNRVQGGDPL